MAVPRLRKTFHYPADDSNEDDTPNGLDEEEQEQLIAKLRKGNEEKNEEYLRIFLAIPVVAIFTYLPALLIFPSVTAKLLSLMGISSLACSAYTLFIPNKSGAGANQTNGLFEASDSPINQYLPFLSGALSAVIALNALTISSKKGVHDGFWLLCLLPAVVLAITTYAQRLMLSVDVGELEKLKYAYKGA